VAAAAMRRASQSKNEGAAPSGFLAIYFATSIGQGVLAIFVDAMPAKFGEGAQDGFERFAFFFVFAVLDGGTMRDPVDAFEADDGAEAVEVDPVTPSFAFVIGFKMHPAKGIEDLSDGARGFRVGNNKLSFHDWR